MPWFTFLLQTLTVVTLLQDEIQEQRTTIRRLKKCLLFIIITVPLAVFVISRTLECILNDK